MNDDQNRIGELMAKYTRSELNQSEFEEFCTLIRQPENDDTLKALLENEFNDASFDEMDKGQLDSMLSKILQKTLSDTTTLKVVRWPMITWKRVAAAASILLILSVGGYLIFKNKENQSIAKVEPQEKRFKNDVTAPTKTKATITLADGSSVALDSIRYGKLATQGNVNVMMTADGKLVYKPQSASTSLIMQYNTLNNPRGSKVIDMTLADGSKVWLNAGSSLTYPVSFAGNERKVSITGEAYFEVTHNAAMPFKVSKGEMEVTDLGTSFNVNAYDDEADIRVTLLEGSVKVSKGTSSNLLKPGEQGAFRQAQGDIKIVKGVDLEEVMAWKNGRFELNGNTIEPIMRELSRWYDVDVIYEGPKPTDNFMGGTSRQGNISELLKILELTKAVRFKIDGRKVTVMRP